MTIVSTKQCVRSGFCCRQAPCPYGEWDAERHQCKFLEIDQRIDDYVTHKCGKYEEIRKIPGADFSPAFGAGCSSTLFNENRARIIAARIRNGGLGTEDAR